MYVLQNKKTYWKEDIYVAATICLFTFFLLKIINFIAMKNGEHAMYTEQTSQLKGHQPCQTRENTKSSRELIRPTFCTSLTPIAKERGSNKVNQHLCNSILTSLKIQVPYSYKHSLK